jgi:Reverse transcriptase (RNA-dependent DNA polymerase)
LNPLLDNKEYEVKFADGTVQAVTANVIAEAIYSQIDDYGRSYTLLQEITDHHFTDKVVKKEDGWVTNGLGVRKQKVTTKGVDFTIEWRNGSTLRIALKDLKESNPVEVAKYAVANKIDDEPAFAWWVRDVLKLRDRVIKKLKMHKVWQETMKFGIELPRTVQEALEIDRRTGTTYWRDAINKEMATVAHVFEFFGDDEVPGNYQFVRCHMVFDVKMDLTRKARFVAGGHMTDPPINTTYSSVVSRDSIRIAFLIAALNDLDILACDIQGAYLNTQTKELIYKVVGLEQGKHREGQKAIIKGALYGLKSTGLAGGTTLQTGYVTLATLVVGPTPTFG